MILEDDAHLSNDLPALLAAIDMPNDAIRMLKMEASPMGVDVTRRPIEVLAPYRIHHLRGPSQGCAAYLINTATARELLRHAEEVARPIDMWMFDPAVVAALGLDMRQVIPAPCVQDQNAAPATRQGLISAIGWRDTVEVRTGEFFRSLVRPFYRRALALTRLSSGLARVGVTFR